MNKTTTVSSPYETKRLRALREKYPAEDVRQYLRMQRRWIRHVVQMHDMTHVQRCAALFIGSFMTPSTPFCYAGMDYICRQVDCERTTVHRAVKLLEERGYLKVDRMKRGGNAYLLRMPFGEG